MGIWGLGNLHNPLAQRQHRRAQLAVQRRLGGGDLRSMV